MSQQAPLEVTCREGSSECSLKHTVLTSSLDSGSSSEISLMVDLCTSIDYKVNMDWKRPPDVIVTVRVALARGLLGIHFLTIFTTELW